MWRWKLLVVAIVLFKHNSSQPIAASNNGNNRPLRQLNFEECCPCPDKNNRDTQFNDGFADSMEDSTEAIFSSVRDLDDCPCRLRDSDPQEASSMLFPTVTRSAGNLLRTNGNKDTLKPLFDPEVGLASSVLETLKEVTDEEYEDALARDAAKTAARAVDDFMFADASPQESANIVTIVIKPKDADVTDEVMPDESHIQQSRCVHPIENSRTNLDKTVVPESSLFSQRPRLSKTRPGLLSRHFSDMDGNPDATNINEELIPVNLSIEDIQVEPFKWNMTNIAKTADENVKLGKVPNFRFVDIQDKLKDLSESSLLQTLRDKTHNSFKISSKAKQTNWMPENTTNYKTELSPASSDIRELVQEKVPHIKKKSLWSNDETNSPLSLPNLLNLRDVELIPLKELVSKQLENVRKIKLKSLLSTSSSQRDMNDTEKRNDTTIETFDLNEGSSLLNMQIMSNEERLMDDSNLYSNTDTKNTPMRILDTTISKHNIQTTDKDYMRDENNASDDFITDKSNDVSQITDEAETITENVKFDGKRGVPVDSTCEETDQLQNTIEINDTKPKREFADNFIGKTVSTIKENIIKQLNDLKNIRTNLINKGIRDQETYSSDLENNSLLVSRNTNQTEQHGNEILMQSTTIKYVDLKNNIEAVTMPFHLTLFEDNTEGRLNIFHTDTLNDKRSASNKYEDTSEISHIDLQKLSDSLLQQEEREKRVQYKSKEEFEISGTDNINENIVDSGEFVDKPVEFVVDSNKGDTSKAKYNEAISFRNDSPEIAPEEKQCVIDSDGDASEIKMNIVPEPNDIISVPRPQSNFLNMPLPNLNNVLQRPPFQPLPIFDDIKLKLANLFDRDASRSHFEKAGNSHAEKLKEAIKMDDLNERNTEDNNYKGESMESKFDLIDTKVDCNDMDINNTVKDNDMLDSQSMQPLQGSSLKELQLPHLNDIWNKSALDTQDKVKVELINDEDNQGVNWLKVKKCDNIKELDVIETATPEEMKEVHNMKKDIVVLKPSPASVEENLDNDSVVESKKGEGILEPQLSFLSDSLQNFNKIINIPTPKPLEVFDDIKERVANLFKKQNINVNEVDISEPNYIQDKSFVEIGQIYNINEETKDSSCKSDLLPKFSTSDVMDASVGASNMALNIIPENYKIIGLQSTGQKKLDPLKELISAPVDISNVPLVEPLSMLDNMVTDASTPSFQSHIPSSQLLDKGSSDIFQRKPEYDVQQSVPKFNRHSYKTKNALPKNINFKSMNSPAPLEHPDILEVTPTELIDPELTTGIASIQSNKNLLSTLINPLDINSNFDNVKEKYLDSPTQATNKIYSTSRNLKKPLEARLNQIANNKLNALNKPITRSSSLLDTISRNHEEFNDKLKTLHMDFNDRLESIRSDLFDRSKLLTNRARNIELPFTLSNNQIKQNKVKQSVKKMSSAPNNRQSLKSLVPHKPAESKFIKTISLSKNEPKKFRMPTAASVPIPKTVQVPELKTISTKLPPLALQRALLKTQSWRSGEPYTKDTFKSSGRQPIDSKTSNTRKEINGNKKSIIKVSFSTTVRPSIRTENMVKDSSLRLKDFNRLTPYKRIAEKDDNLKSLPIDTRSKKISDIQSWPKATESSFLSKVKDAVQTRLSMKSPNALKHSQLRSNDWKNNIESIFNTDMTRAASNSKAAIDASLKENVSYKCKMICGKE